MSTNGQAKIVCLCILCEGWGTCLFRSVTNHLFPSAFTAEQYQQHQEQLALMHKEQLEQVQLQQQANSTATANSTHVSVQPIAHTQNLL